MRIVVLGTRGQIESSAPWHSKHSGVLVNDLLFDFGETEYLKLKPSHVFLTHLHPDHAVFLRKDVPKIKARVFGPETSPELPIMKKLAKPVRAGGCRVSPLPTIHSKKGSSQAYEISKGGKRVLYTGDIVRFGHGVKLKKYDLVVADGSFVRKGGLVRTDGKGRMFGHAGIPDLVKLFKKHTNHLVFSHFGEWFYRDIKKARKKIKNFGEEEFLVEACRDGQEFVV